MTDKTDAPPWVLVGHVGVDSASLWLGDPCYPPRSGTPISEVCCPDDMHYGFCDANDKWPHSGLYFFTLSGDGTYPVYAQIDPESERPLRVMVDLDPDEEPSS